MSRNERGRFGALKSDSTHHFFRNACIKSGSLRFSVFRLLTDFVCLYTYEFWLSLCKIVRSSVILLLPLFRHHILPIHFPGHWHSAIYCTTINFEYQNESLFNLLQFISSDPSPQSSCPSHLWFIGSHGLLPFAFAHLNSRIGAHTVPVIKNENIISLCKIDFDNLQYFTT